MILFIDLETNSETHHGEAGSAVDSEVGSVVDSEVDSEVTSKVAV